MQVTDQTLSSSLSSERSVHGTREVRSFTYAVRGSTATQPAGSPSTYAITPLVDDESGVPHAVWSCSIPVRSSRVETAQIQPRILNR